ncbi:MAG: DMT family transporter [Pseudomonadota bacterium]
MKQQLHMQTRDWLLLLLLGMIWGGSFYFAKIALSEIPPLTLVLLRVVIAAAALAIIIKASGDRLPGGRRLWLTFAAMGLLNNLIPFTLLFWGQTHIGAGLASIFNAMTPLFTVLVAHAATRDEKLNSGKVLGVLLGLTGVATIIGIDASNGANTITMLAMLACVGAAGSYALASVYGRRFGATDIAPVQVAFGQLAATSVMMFPIALITERPWSLPVPSLGSWGALLSLALVCTAFAYLLFFRILQRGGATNISLVTFIIPVSAILLSSLLLGEQLGVNHLIGVSLILAGLAALDGRFRKRPNVVKKAEVISCQHRP